MEEKREFKGYSLFIILSGFLQNFVIINFGNYWGIYQEYYTSNNMFNTSIFNITFMGSLAIGLIFGLSLITKIFINRKDYKFFLYIGILFCSLGMLLSSFANKIWQMYLTLSLLFGIGGSFIIVLNFSIPILWFEKNKTLASGLCSSGTGIGSLTISIISRKLINILDIKWTLRIISLIQFILGIISSYLMRYPKNYEYNKYEKKKYFNLKIIKNECFIIWFIVNTLFSFCVTIPFTFIPSYTTFLGLSAFDGAIFVGTASISNSIGKIFIGISILLFSISIGTILSTPLSSILISRYSYLSLILYTGFLFICAMIFLIILKIKLIKYQN